jgi:MATE family multidrug resistance protein
VLFTIVGTLPYDAVNALAGMTAGMRVESLLFLPGMAFSMTASILVGQSLGASKPKEAKHIGRKLLIVGIASMSSVAVVLWLFIDPICAWLTPDAAVQVHARAYLRITIFSTPFTLTSMTLTGVMSGAGATLYSFIANGSGFWLVRLPMAYLLGHIIWQTSTGVFLSMLVGQMVQASLLLFIFECKNWPRFSMIKRRTKE